MLTVKETGRIDTCPACGHSLPLRLPAVGRQGADWICTGCGARFEAVLDRNAPPDLLRNVRPASVRIDRDRLVHPPQALASFVAELVKENGNLSERRAFPRRVLVAPVAVVPVDEDYLPVDDAFMAITRDVSSGGVSLVHSRAVDSKLLVVELPKSGGEVIQVAVRVLRCRPLGRFYEIGGVFVVRLDA
jgi:predicted RNA-binding Zn-ribbon protein involved in translation (DUF1610 family)